MKKINQDFDFSVKGKNRKKEYNLLKDLLRFSEEIYSARMALKMSQQDLAKEIGTTQKVISKIENAEVNFGIDLMLRISRTLNIQVKFGNFLSLPEVGNEQPKIHNFLFHSLEETKVKQVNYEKKEPYYTNTQCTGEVVSLKK